MNYTIVTNELVEGLSAVTAFGINPPTRVMCDMIKVESFPRQTGIGQGMFSKYEVHFRHYMVEMETVQKTEWVLNEDGSEYIEQGIFEDDGTTPVMWERIAKDENGQELKVLRTGHLDPVSGKANISTVPAEVAQALRSQVFTAAPPLKDLEMIPQEDAIWKLGFKIQCGQTFQVNPNTGFSEYPAAAPRLYTPQQLGQEN